MQESIRSRSFSASDQRSFATLCGDWNPMHMDPIAARRTQAGASVVHGVHAVLWALDCLIATGNMTAVPTSLEVRFQKFLYLETEIRLVVARKTKNAFYAELWAGDLMTTAIKIGVGASIPVAGIQEFDVRPVSPMLAPNALTYDDLAAAAGRLPLGDREATKRDFPHVARLLGATRTASIAQLSTIVGMHCPGLHSIFSGFTVHLETQAADDAANEGVAFRTRSVDDRFNMVEIDVVAGGLSGMITAFLRQGPIAAPTLRELAELRLIENDAFAGVTALIVGGSRGLGALTAKVIASGGGRVVITYHVGESEARAIVDEIGSHACTAMRYDASEGASPQLAELDWTINQLYYFATTHISRQKGTRYSPSHFAAFCDLYVNGFEAVCMALRGRGAAELSAFYPSSVFVEERPRGMTEYSMAKAAGELLCADMNRAYPDMRIVVKRLPRLLTDQTAVVVPTESADPLQTMLPIVRELWQSSRAAAASVH